MRVTVVLVLCVISVVLAQDDCPPCDLSKCESLTCSAGQVFPGPCACCPVCALSEGERCYNSTIKVLKKPPESEQIIPCGENMACLLRHDLGPHDSPEALCVCKQPEPVCGSDGRTYDNICALTKISMKYSNQGSTLFMQSWGPCKAAPAITSNPEDSSGPLNHGLALDCEARGFPIPDIHWEFTGDDGVTRNMPSDDLYVAVQVRGGPENYMVTSWLQIVNLRHTDTGTYTCVASNSEGVVRAHAKVGVYKATKQRRMTRRH